MTAQTFTLRVKPCGNQIRGSLFSSKSVKETLVCDHSNDTIEQLFYMKLFYTVQGGSKIFTDFFTDHSNERY